MSAPSLPRWRFVAALTVLTVSMSEACGTTAFIHVKRELPVEAEIVGGSPERIYVHDSGGQASILREDIADIDHPGTGHILVGALGIGLGLVALGYGLATQDDKGATSFNVPALVEGAIAVPVFAWGVKTSYDSETAAKDTSRPEPEERPRRRPPKALPGNVTSSPTSPPTSSPAESPAEPPAEPSEKTPE